MNERVKQLLVLGREHYAKREFEKAEQMLRMVLEEEDRYADVHDMLGVIAHSRGNFLVAERHFERALEINPDADPNSRLENIIMQRRARWLLDRVNDLFLPPLEE